MKIKNKALLPFLFVFLVATPLSFCLSGFNTWRIMGFSDGFFTQWMQNWLIGFLMVYPLALVFVAIAKRIILKIS
ncbi:MAG TPA: DUF2798 domain-containing protein [Flavobacteriales bacterium]|nr:DUF2798 domain-containing protein [Flavobacteriales bacterium]HRE97871.1 DUF2798 domain-containing protein [Flavobacteriales bacterium]HRJ39279.1 DUF2798 domain-containing protein [Flavobacteriales bacterium]